MPSRAPIGWWFVFFLVALGLVVVGALCLVIGYVTEAAAVIYLSLACSLTAFVALVAYARMGKRQEAAASDSPAAAPTWTPAAPAPEVAAPEPASAEVSAAPRWGDRVTADSERTTVTPAATAVVDEDEEEEEDEEAALPIEGYDGMRVAQILPLLPSLDLDELAAVRDHEEEGRNRATVIRRVDQLMDELEAAEEPEEAESSEVADADRTTVLPRVSEFPIEDYDRRTVSQILARLDDLSDDELDMVAERERAGRNRAVVLDAIDAQFEEVDEEPDVVEEVDEEPPVVEEVEEEPAAEEEADAGFPIPDYDTLRVNQILPLLPALDRDQLEAVRLREEQGRNRTTLLRRLDEAMAEQERAQATAVEDEQEGAQDGFPIPDYDRRTVAEILPLLDELDNDELDMVAEYEERGKNRGAILDAIDAMFEEVDEEDAGPPAGEVPVDPDTTATMSRARNR